MHPEWERPIRVNMFFPIIYTIATIFITIVPMIASPIETGTRLIKDPYIYTDLYIFLFILYILYVLSFILYVRIFSYFIYKNA